MLAGGPECPQPLRYLLADLYAVHGRSGMTQAGIAPLAWTTLDAWSRLTGLTLAREEIDALFTLDTVLSHPGEMQAVTDG